MAYEIKSESYGRRLPKITATADSTDDLSTLGTDWAEGSTCVISDTTYKLDKVKGWVDPSSDPSGGGGGVFLIAEDNNYTLNKTWKEIYDAATSGLLPIIQHCDPEIKYVWTVAVEGIQKSGFAYKITVTDAGSPLQYSTDSEDGYPVSEES